MFVVRFNPMPSEKMAIRRWCFYSSEHVFWKRYVFNYYIIDSISGLTFKSQIRELTFRYHALLVIPHLIQNTSGHNPSYREDDVRNSKNHQPKEADVKEGHAVEAYGLLGLCGEALKVRAALESFHFVGDDGELTNDDTPFSKLVVIFIKPSFMHIQNIIWCAYTFCYILQPSLNKPVLVV